MILSYGTAARALGLSLTLGALAACSGGSGAPMPAATPAYAPSLTQPQSGGPGTVSYGRSLLAGATYLGPAHLKTVGLDVYVPMRDRPGLLQYARQANDPHSSLFRHWLTPAELGDRFGALKSDYAAVVAHLTAGGIAVQTYPQRQMMRLRGPQTGVERALGFTFGVYKKNRQTFLAPANDPHPPGNLRIAALGNAVGYVTRVRTNVPVRGSAALTQGFAPQQIADAFDYVGAYRAGFTGRGITIGIIGTGPITDGDPRLAPGDAATYRAGFAVGGSGTVAQDIDLTNVSPGNPGVPGAGYSSGLATPPPVTAPNAPGCIAQGYDPSNPPFYGITDYTTCNPEDFESQLDTEQASGLAPDANVLFYIAYNPNECFAPGACNHNPATPALGLALSDDEIQQAIADNRSDVISMSFGGSEQSSFGVYFDSSGQGFGPTEFQSLAAEGIAVFASSGDSGAQGCPGSNGVCVGYPATDPSVVSVGGVNSPIDASGRLSGPLTGWGQQTANGGSGGGCSAYFAAPPYESAIPNFPCGGMRAQPDVSLDADTNTGVTVIFNSAQGLGGPQFGSVGGTSVAAPEAAAMWALVLQACSQTASCRARGSGPTPYRLGNPNAYFYPIYTNAARYAATFYDVQFGKNGQPYVPSGAPGPTPVPSFAPGYAAGPGYDLVTGIGVPFGRNLIRAVVGV